MKKYISLSDIENAIKLLKSYKEEHHPDGELYYALAIAIHIMCEDYYGIIDDLMAMNQEEKYDS